MQAGRQVLAPTHPAVSSPYGASYNRLFRAGDGVSAMVTARGHG